MFGLSDLTIKKIREVLERHPGVEKAILYGSRAMGNYSRGSDIDICLTGESVHFSELLRIESEMDELLLPYRFDISVYHKIENKELLAHIDRMGIVFYERNSD